MGTERPFRFGVSSAAAESGRDWLDTARRVEDLGFEVLSVSDHVGSVLPPFPALAAAAQVTARLTLGTLVLNNDFRHPALVAWEAAASSLLTGGRFELGLGAGHARPEYESLGVVFDPPPVRVARLAESVHIVKGLLAGEEVDHEGDHYGVHHRLPAALTDRNPRPRLLIGGNNRSLLRMAAREADVVGVTGAGRTLPDGQHHEPSGFPPAAVDETVALIREAAGERVQEIEMHALIQGVIVTADRRGEAEQIAARFPLLTPDVALGTPFLLIGTVDEIVDDLLARRERWGFTYYTVFAHTMDAMAPVVERLGGRIG